MVRCIRIATRSSPLAQWQARHVAALLQQAWPGITCQLIPITAAVDTDLSSPLYGMGNTGVFVKEVQQLLLEDKADVAVHSCKDLPTEQPQQLSLAAVCKRHDPRDAIIGVTSIDELPQGACIGTSSLRRRAELQQLRPDLRFENIRGNVGTRLRKIEDGQYDATLMACAGLKRLGIMRSLRLQALNPYSECCPSPAQGAVAVDCLHQRADMQRLLQRIDHHETRIAVGIERQVLHGLRGGCSLPFGCLVRRHELRWHCYARLSNDEQPARTVSCIGHASALAAQVLRALQDA